jgi:pilus assembly protein CpaC
MRRLALPLILVVALAGTRALAQQELTVGVGEQKIVSVPAGSEVSFTGPLHVKRVDSGRIKVIGDSPGWGSLTLKNGDDLLQYSVTVAAVPPEQIIAKLKALFGSLPLTYTTAGDQVVIEGRIETAPELDRFNRVIEMFPGVVNMVVVTAKEPMIDIAVTLVEVEVDNSSGVGILDITTPTGKGTMSGTIPLGDITAGKVNSGDIQVSLSMSAELLDALHAQIESGRAKIIANPRIVTMNRQQASITSGGDIPYRVVGATGAQGVQYKPYGISLIVTPEERANDVLMQLKLESSEPVGTVSGASENPLTSRSIELNVAVEKDKSLAIAGLYNAVTSRATRGGCLFPLFATSATTRRREIVVLVTPRVTIDGIRQDNLKMLAPGDLKR